MLYGWIVGERGERLLLNGKGEYAGKLGTPYPDWHTTPRKAPTLLDGDRL